VIDAAVLLAGEGRAWTAGRYLLSPLEAGDASDILSIFGDPAVVEYMDIPPVADLDEAREIIGWATGKREQGLGVRWAVRRSADSPLIGTCGFNLLELDRGRRGEIAYDLARDHWGQGVMSEILPHLVRFGFERLELGRLEAYVTAGNAASCRLLERQGFRREGVLRDHGYWKGRYWDQIVYGRLSTD
jgi:ribosomal-protein-alanine N-acetyltransferase